MPHTVIADNAGGHLMQRGRVDFCIAGTDRTTRARRRLQQDRHLPEGAGRPRQRRALLCRPALSHHRLDDRPTARDIPIEERSAREVSHISGRTATGEIVTVDVLPEGSPAANPAFDVTPARLVTALITERGVCAASEAGLLSLYPEQARAA